jgi:hypothetical protein
MRSYIAACLMISLGNSGGQVLSRAEISEAIEQGRAGKSLQKTCAARGENGFDIIVEGPIGRVMRAAREAKRRDQDLKADDLPASVTAPVLTVTARRDSTLATGSISVPTSNLPGVWGVAPDSSWAAERSTARQSGGLDYRIDATLRSKPPRGAEPAVLRPVGLRRTLPLPGHDMTAQFDLAAFRAMPHRDLEVIVFMTDAGEHRCGISARDREKLR